MTNTPSMPRSADEVQDSRALELGMRVGLVAYGAMHLLFAFIGLQLAWTSSSTRSQGALNHLADDPFGLAVLWGSAVGLLLLAVWQTAEAAAGYSYAESNRRLRKRVSSGGRAAVYLSLAWLAVSTAAGIGSSSSKDTLTAQVMAYTAGRILIGAVGVGIVAVGVRQAYKGVKQKFTDDLEPRATSGQSGRTLLRLGQVGYVAKGFSLGVVGALFVWAAWDYDPQKAGGLDAALRTLLQQPFGQWLLSAVAVGLAAFGAYCFGWARYART